MGIGFRCNSPPWVSTLAILAGLAAGYPIGSGVAEGACRHLVKDRMERTGMRWTEDGAQAILDLRSTYLNGDWKEYWTHYSNAENERLYGHLTLDSSTTYKATG